MFLILYNHKKNMTLNVHPGLNLECVWDIAEDSICNKILSAAIANNQISGS